LPPPSRAPLPLLPSLLSLALWSRPSSRTRRRGEQGTAGTPFSVGATFSPSPPPNSSRGRRHLGGRNGKENAPRPKHTHTHLTLAFLGWAAPCLPAGGNPATPSLPPAPPSQRTTGLRRRPRPQRRGTSLECSFSTAASPCSGRASRGTRGTNRLPTGPRRRSRRGRRRSGRRGSRLRRRRRSRRPPGSAVAPPA